MFCWIPRTWQSSLVNLDTKRGSLLLIIQQGAGKSVVVKYGVQKKLHCPLGHNGFVAGYELHHLGAAVVSDCEYRIMSSWWGQLSDEVQCDDFKQLCVFCRVYWLERSLCRLVVHLVLLALLTSPHVVGDVSPQSGPPAASLYEVHCLTDAWVSVGWGVM